MDKQRYLLFAHTQRGTKDTQAVLKVVSWALAYDLSLCVAVERCRQDLRSTMRDLRKREKRARSRHPKMAEHYLERVARLRIESARIRRLQRTFASWQPSKV